MHQITTHHDFDAPAHVLWDYLQDFANIERWWPKDVPAVQIERVVIEGEGIGLVRHIYNKGFPTAVSERLDALEPESMTYRLSIVGERPAGIESYQATGRIEALGENRCRLNYESAFSVAPGREEEAQTFLRVAYELMFQGLASALARDVARL